jgi:SAM-dependent methyltransferase
MDVVTTLVAELLCESAGARPGQVVLDVATGGGNGALAAARRGCKARGVDPVPALLDRARERARAERLRASFQLGDPEALPFADESFDVALSIFGVMFADDAKRAARELVRVCRPGGTIGLAAWAADGFSGAIHGTAAQHASLAHGASEFAAWGTERGLRALFGRGIGRREVHRRSFIIRCRSPECFLDFLRSDYGLTHSAFRQLDGPGQAALARALMAVVEAANRSRDGTMIVPAGYLEMVAIKR